MEVLWAKSEELDKMTKTSILFCLWTKQMNLQAEANKIFVLGVVYRQEKKATCSGFSTYKTEQIFSDAYFVSLHGKFTCVK